MTSAFSHGRTALATANPKYDNIIHGSPLSAISPPLFRFDMRESRPLAKRRNAHVVNGR
jgi:hypothetical protein